MRLVVGVITLAAVMVVRVADYGGGGGGYAQALLSSGFRDFIRARYGAAWLPTLLREDIGVGGSFGGGWLFC